MQLLFALVSFDGEDMRHDGIMVGVDGMLFVDTIKKQEMSNWYVVPYPNLHEYFQNRAVTSCDDKVLLRAILGCVKDESLSK